MSRKKINYYKEVFLHPWNLIYLCAALGISFVLSLLVSGAAQGLVLTLLLFTAASELVLMGWLTRQPRFRRFVKAKQARHLAKPPTSRELYSELNNANQRRYFRLRDRQKKIEANYQKFSYASQGLLDSHIKKIDGLVSSCLSMMHQQERFSRYTSALRESEVLGDLARLKKEAEHASDQVRRIKLRRLRVLEHRLTRFKKGQEQLEIINEQIETIEDVVDYIHEQSMTLQNPEKISLQLDVLMADVEETEASLGSIESTFGDGSFVGLDDLEGFGISEETPSAAASGARRRKAR